MTAGTLRDTLREISWTTSLKIAASLINSSGFLSRPCQSCSGSGTGAVQVLLKRADLTAVQSFFYDAKTNQQRR